MDEAGKAKRDRARAKAAWARHASGSVVGSGPGPVFAELQSVDWSNRGSWPFWSAQRVFLAEAVTLTADGIGAGDVADEASRAEPFRLLRQAFADGVVTAFRRDDEAEDHEIRANFWSLPDAVATLETCRLDDCWVMVSGAELARLLETVSGPTAVPPAPSIVPSWHIRNGETQSSWFLRPEVREEAGRRQKRRSIKALAQALVEMGAEFGRSFNAASLETAMRNSGQFANSSRTITSSSRT